VRHYEDFLVDTSRGVGEHFEETVLFTTDMRRIKDAGGPLV
jgi:hypothetical protein